MFNMGDISIYNEFTECHGWNDPQLKKGLFKEGICRYRISVKENEDGYVKHCEIDFRTCKIRITEAVTPNGNSRDSMFICKHNTTVLYAKDFLMSDLFQQIWSGALGSSGRIPK